MLPEYSIGVPLANFCESHFSPIPLAVNDSINQGGNNP
jgi:hypothetical protein